MCKIIVAGSGTDVGKTIVSAILTTVFDGDYWKPIECAEEEASDTNTIKKWIDPIRHHIYPPAYSLKAPLSPHHAARLENISIQPEAVRTPSSARPLIIESVGGIFVPLTARVLSIDLFKQWNGQWIVVSRHYLGSINHTLLTLEALKQRNIDVAGLIFNGEPNIDSETAILDISHLPMLGRLLPEETLNSQTIQRYAKQWLPRFLPLIH